MDFATYQQRALLTDQAPLPTDGEPDGRAMLVPLLGLAGEVGELLSEYKKLLRDGKSHKLFQDRVAEELGDLLWYLSNAATKFGLDLDEVAARNLAKCRDRWAVVDRSHLDTMSRPIALDAGFPEAERLPRQFVVVIEPVDGGSRVMIRALVNGRQAGDDLTDNAYEDDGYRFHDVFHLAYAAVLGWSPVLRQLLRRKRKSMARVDEVEDGGRAKAIEEGISAMVFSYAVDHNFLDGAEGVDFDLLRTIKRMTAHLEVSRCSAGEWERAILVGFEVWRRLRALGGASLAIDLDAGTIRLVQQSADVPA